MKHPILSINELSKRYKKFSFGPLDLQIERGTVVALVGPNGSGKSTFFRLIMNLVRADKGTVKCFGKCMNMYEMACKQKIGYVAGDLFQILGHLTIQKLADLVSYWYPSWNWKRYAELIDRYEIDEQEKYANCSTGTKKKVDFIFAMAHDPELLLLDEPSSGVDMVSQR